MGRVFCAPHHGGTDTRDVSRSTHPHFASLKLSRRVWVEFSQSSVKWSLTVYRELHLVILLRAIFTVRYSLWQYCEAVGFHFTLSWSIFFYCELEFVSLLDFVSFDCEFEFVTSVWAGEVVLLWASVCEFPVNWIFLDFFLKEVYVSWRVSVSCELD